MDLVKSSGVLFENCLIKGTSNSLERNGITLRAGSGVVIKDCFFKNLSNAVVFTAVAYYGSDRYYNTHKIVSNNFDNCDLPISLAGEFRDSIIVSHNKIDYCKAGIYIDNSSNQIAYTHIYSNEILRCSDYAIHSDHSRGSNSLRIYNNMIQGGKNITQYSNGQSYSQIVSVFMENDQNLQFYNNSIKGSVKIMNSDYSFFYNNSISSGKGFSLITSGLTNFNSDHNNYYNDKTRDLIIHNNTAYSNLQSFQLAHQKLDSNSISADPEYYSGLDLHSNSLALHKAGTPVWWITTDIDGQLRDTLTPDIGADEFQRDTTLPAKSHFSYICSGSLKFDFFDHSIRSDSIKWIFNKLDTLFGSKTSYTFPDTGVFEVKHLAYNYYNNNSSNSHKNIRVSDYQKILRSNDTLSISSGFSHYQWYLNNGILPNANKHDYKFLFNGYYHVEYDNANGCTLTSDTINVINVGINNEKLSPDFTFYPNPVTQGMHIKIHYKQEEQARIITIVDIYGKVVSHNQLNSDGYLNLDYLRSGIYFIHINLGGNSLNKRFIKID
jgi:hypothetical protein